MKVTAWSNGSPPSSGAGYGIWIGEQNRHTYFQREWDSVRIQLEDGEEVEVRLSESFWKKCPELRSAAIGRWLLANGLAPWPEGQPPTL